MDSSLITMDQLGLEDLTIRDWVDVMGITQFSVFIDKDYDCTEDIKFSVIYNKHERYPMGKGVPSSTVDKQKCSFTLRYYD